MHYNILKMNKTLIISVMCLVIIGCSSDKSKSNHSNLNLNKSGKEAVMESKYLKPFKKELPTIGLLMYNGVLQGEVIATSDVFAKHDKNGEQIFNVIAIAETKKPITTEEGMKFVPDYTFDNCPKLTVLFVPSAYDMHAQVNNTKTIDFIRDKNQETEFMVSNCAGAQLIGEIRNC